MDEANYQSLNQYKNMENVSYYRSFLAKDLKKLFSIMKITVILLFVALFQAVAIESSYSQSVTVSIKAEREVPRAEHPRKPPRPLGAG